MSKKPDKPSAYKEYPATDQPITDTLVKNYMPYAMSVIVSRAIPEIDGFKPSHRKLLYTMYKKNLLNGNRTKSANIVGETMKLNPHGDAAIYETMVRLTRGNEALLVPFVDSKGNFGKVYSRDMAYAAARYTEAKLDAVCIELFRDIDCDAVDFVDNYDGSMKEPTLLPTTFPNILASANTGIAVGMASNFCGFNLHETCRTAIECIKNPEHDILSTLPAPDFSTGGEIIFDEAEMRRIYETGRGSFKVRAKWQYVKKENLIEVTSIPYTTTIEAIIDKVAELAKAGKVREISDIRDETDLSGLKLAIDLKRGVDPEKLMAKLMKMTPLMDSFACNFNVLIGGMPRVLGVRALLEEWTAWRTECVRRRVFYDLNKKQEKLHLLKGLSKILLDIDRAIQIIRGTEEDAEVIPNLMIGFGIDDKQAEYIAEIRLRHINKEYILKRVQETEELEKEIGRLKGILESRAKIQGIIIKELEAVIKKYPAPRRCDIIYAHEVEEYDEQDSIEDYPVLLFMTREGYFKKITPASFRMGSEHKLKDGDEVVWQAEATNRTEIIFLTDRQQAYKARLHDFDDCKASALGDFLPQKLGMEDGEAPVFAFLPGDYKSTLVVVFQNGKAARFSVDSFETKTNRRRLTGAYSDKCPAVAFFVAGDEDEITLFSTANRAMTFRVGALDVKATRSTQGVQAMVLRGKNTVTRACRMEEAGLSDNGRYRCRTIPSIGAILRDEDLPDKQLTL
ncbi:DNA gyrase subunit A [Intestinibacillus massiliensis]|uniref:DNA gyrase subunit A n=1 Tax=Intestinibacillus massiliensis TaxID=1871029 RepID=UPI000B364495|nr:DNA topoisomerase (ATP-hydrolyzing) subunit A [Intestinibacillus massiliensis]